MKYPSRVNLKFQKKTHPNSDDKMKQTHTVHLFNLLLLLIYVTFKLKLALHFLFWIDNILYNFLLKLCHYFIKLGNYITIFNLTILYNVLLCYNFIFKHNYYNSSTVFDVVFGDPLW